VCETRVSCTSPQSHHERRRDGSLSCDGQASTPAWVRAIWQNEKQQTTLVPHPSPLSHLSDACSPVDGTPTATSAAMAWVEGERRPSQQSLSGTLRWRPMVAPCSSPLCTPNHGSPRLHWQRHGGFGQRMGSPTTASTLQGWQVDSHHAALHTLWVAASMSSTRENAPHGTSCCL
jgi:hypothetical protein